MLIYHLIVADEWKRLENEAEYRAASLETEGFIHCSRRSQLNGVAERYFAAAGPLVALVIDTSRLSSPLIEEASPTGEIFPHVYGPIERSAIIDIEPFTA